MCKMHTIDHRYNRYKSVLEEEGQETNYQDCSFPTTIDLDF